MPHVLTVQGSTEVVFDDEQFARLLDERLGYDAAEYFRNAVVPDSFFEHMNPTDEQILKNGWCSGECDRVQGTQEHYENLLKEIGTFAREIRDKILEGYHVGGRRTKKEQVAIDKAVEIMKVVKQNT